MRLLIANYGDAQIYRDRSDSGVPRWVILWPLSGRSQIFNKAWYSLDRVKEFVEKELCQN